MGKRYNTTLNLNGSYHGISLELGAYVAKIQPGSVAAKEGSIAVGDRIVGVRIIKNAWCLKITVKKVSFNVANFVYILSGRKFRKTAKDGPF